jgi:hypothetical protein
MPTVGPSGQVGDLGSIRRITRAAVGRNCTMRWRPAPGVTGSLT